MSFGVEREHARWPDHHVVYVRACVAHLHGVQDVPALQQLRQFLADLLFALGSDTPGAFVGLDAETLAATRLRTGAWALTSSRFARAAAPAMLAETSTLPETSTHSNGGPSTTGTRSRSVDGLRRCPTRRRRLIDGPSHATGRSRRARERLQPARQRTRRL